MSTHTMQHYDIYQEMPLTQGHHVVWKALSIQVLEAITVLMEWLVCAEELLDLKLKHKCLGLCHCLALLDALSQRCHLRLIPQRQESLEWNAWLSSCSWFNFYGNEGFKGPTDVSCFGVKLMEISLKSSRNQTWMSLSSLHFIFTVHILEIQIILACFASADPNSGIWTPCFSPKNLRSFCLCLPTDSLNFAAVVGFLQILVQFDDPVLILLLLNFSNLLQLTGPLVLQHLIINNQLKD